MLYRDEIEKRLKGIDPQLCVAFAARCSLRVLPLLVFDGTTEFIPFWPEPDQSSHVLAVLTTQRISINFSAFGRKVYATTAYAAAAAAADSTAAAYVAYAAGAENRGYYAPSYLDAANAAAAAAYAADAAAYAYANDATATAAAAAAAAEGASQKVIINLEIEIDRDLNNITNEKRSVFSKLMAETISPSDFIYSPLWSDSPPEDWQLLFSRFNKSLLALNEGFEIWVDWYQDRINAVPLDKEQEEKWLNIPEEIKVQEAKARNAYLATLISSRQPGDL